MLIWSQKVHIGGGDFLEKYIASYPKEINNLLEIGCSYGYNLNYLSNRLGFECYGLEPSDKAVNFGIERWKISNERVHLIQGISNMLPFNDHAFDVVILGFSLYVTPREMIADSVLEVNRVLKEGGFLILTDFDTPVFYKRVNKHNEGMAVYKEDYAKRFLTMGFSLVEKTSYSHGGDCFNPDIQERVSTQILYKEFIDELYVQA